MTDHLIALKDFSREQLVSLVERAIELKKDAREGKRHLALAGKTISMLFDKPSTRTRVSFEAAMETASETTEECTLPFELGY